MPKRNIGQWPTQQRDDASEDDVFGLDGARLNANRANHRPARASFLFDVETMRDLLRSCCELVLPHNSLVNR